MKIGSESVRPYFIFDNRLWVAAATRSALDNSEGGVVNMGPKKSLGASNIDLQNATVQWVGPSGMYYLVDSMVQPSGAEDQFSIVPPKDADDFALVLNDLDDCMVMVFDLDDTDSSHL